MNAEKVKHELKKYVNPKKAKHSPKFFKTEKGQYGEGDEFIGVSVPDQRKVAKQFKELPLSEVKKLILANVHEYRLTALFILVHQYKAKKSDKKQIVDFYIENISGVNNWDLVDSSAHKILGPYLEDKDKTLLYDFAKSDNLWKQRIAIIATFHYIMSSQFEDALAIAEILVNHEHDLIHKAVGWMLREIGKKDQQVEEKFLKKHYKNMPRTMLRYAIEKFPEDLRQGYLNGTV